MCNVWTDPSQETNVALQDGHTAIHHVSGFGIPVTGSRDITLPSETELPIIIVYHNVDIRNCKHPHGLESLRMAIIPSDFPELYFLNYKEFFAHSKKTNIYDVCCDVLYNIGSIGLAFIGFLNLVTFL